MFKCMNYESMISKLKVNESVASNTSTLTPRCDMLTPAALGNVNVF